jgi:hypothetical protein
MCGRFTATFDSVTYGFAGTSTALHFHAVGKKQTPAFFSAACSSGLDEDAPVADGVLVDLSLGGTSVIGLAVQCPNRKYFGSIRAPGQVYDHVFDFLQRNQGRKLREVHGCRDDLSDVIHEMFVAIDVCLKSNMAVCYSMTRCFVGK